MVRSTLLAALALAALPAQFADATQTYTYQKIAYGGSATGVADINAAGDLVGGYWTGAITATTVRQCIVYTKKTKKIAPLMNPSATGGTECWGLNDAGMIVGDYVTAKAKIGYVYDGTKFTDITPPGAVSTTAWAISNTGEIGGYYTDKSNVQHGFLYDGTAYTEVNAPGAAATGVYGVNASGQYTVEGIASNGVSTSYLYTGTTSVIIKFPKATSTSAHHVNDKGMVCATWVDRTSRDRAGVFDSVANTYTDIAFPSAELTVGDGVNVKGSVAGRYQRFKNSLSRGYRGIN